MKKLMLFIVALFLLVSGFAQALENTLYFTDSLVYEKVYLHLDREIYSPREIIWFKVYLVGGIDNKLLQGFKNVYVELINEEGKIIDDRLVLLSDGVAMGDFNIPYGIREGQYTLRAYTKYLHHFGEESIFHKRIWISSLKRQPIGKTIPEAENIDLSFYPESGNLVLNTPNIVAFKAIDDSGRGIQLSGHIVNDLGERLGPFRSEFLGMGKFSLMPREGRTYFAILDDFPMISYEIGDIREKGIVLQYKAGLNDVHFSLAGNLSGEELKNCIFLVQHKGIALFSEEIEGGCCYKDFTFSKGKFPLGISKISILDHSNNILVERIIFVQGGFENVISVESDFDKYENRKLVTLSLSSLLNEGDTIRGGLSVSVVNKDYLNYSGYNNDMRSYLLLDSELKEPIESPALYFIDDEISSANKLDLLMMVQGYRSYYWPDIIEALPANMEGRDDYGLSISGMVKELFRKDIVRNGEVIIGPFSAGLTFLDTLTNSKGQFRFDHLYLRDSITLMIEAKNEKGTANTEIFLDQMFTPDTMVDISEIDRLLFDPIVPYSFYSRSFAKGEAERKYALESGDNWIEEVSIVEDRVISFSEFMKPEMDRIFGMPEKSRKISDEDYSYFNIFDYLEANPVGGITILGNSLTVRGGKPPLYMVDGIENSEADVAHLHMSDIDYVDFMISGFNMAMFGSRGGNGVIAIYTQHGALSTFKRNIKGRETVKINGFQRPHRVYSPKYSFENFDTEIPDYRPTLFWEPFVFMHDDYAELEFFTSDFQSDYVVIVEGISDSGTICTGMCEFTVGN